jgi:hypothetical protein
MMRQGRGGGAVSVGSGLAVGEGEKEMGSVGERGVEVGAGVAEGGRAVAVGRGAGVVTCTAGETAVSMEPGVGAARQAVRVNRSKGTRDRRGFMSCLYHTSI